MLNLPNQEINKNNDSSLSQASDAELSLQELREKIKENVEFLHQTKRIIPSRGSTSGEADLVEIKEKYKELLTIFLEEGGGDEGAKLREMYLSIIENESELVLQRLSLIANILNILNEKVVIQCEADLILLLPLSVINIQMGKVFVPQTEYLNEEINKKFNKINDRFNELSNEMKEIKREREEDVDEFVLSDIFERLLRGELKSIEINHRILNHDHNSIPFATMERLELLENDLVNLLSYVHSGSQFDLRALRVIKIITDVLSEGVRKKKDLLFSKREEFSRKIEEMERNFQELLRDSSVESIQTYKVINQLLLDSLQMFGYVEISLSVTAGDARGAEISKAKWFIAYLKERRDYFLDEGLAFSPLLLNRCMYLLTASFSCINKLISYSIENTNKAIEKAQKKVEEIMGEISALEEEIAKILERLKEAEEEASSLLVNVGNIATIDPDIIKEEEVKLRKFRDILKCVNNLDGELKNIKKEIKEKKEHIAKIQPREFDDSSQGQKVTTDTKDLPKGQEGGQRLSEKSEYLKDTQSSSRRSGVQESEEDQEEQEEIVDQCKELEAKERIQILQKDLGVNINLLEMKVGVLKLFIEVERGLKKIEGNTQRVLGCSTVQEKRGPEGLIVQDMKLIASSFKTLEWQIGKLKEETASNNLSEKNKEDWKGIDDSCRERLKEIRGSLQKHFNDNIIKNSIRFNDSKAILSEYNKIKEDCPQQAKKKNKKPSRKKLDRTNAERVEVKEEERNQIVR